MSRTGESVSHSEGLGNTLTTGLINSGIYDKLVRSDRFQIDHNAFIFFYAFNKVFIDRVVLRLQVTLFSYISNDFTYFNPIKSGHESTFNNGTGYVGKIHVFEKLVSQDIPVFLSLFFVLTKFVYLIVFNIEPGFFFAHDRFFNLG